MMKQSKKFIAIMLTFVFVLSMVPLGTLAEVAEGELTPANVYFTNYSYTRHSGNSYLNDPGTVGSKGDIRFGGQYFGYVQLDLTGYEEILANENTSIKVSVYCGPYTTSQRECGDFKAYLVNDIADASYVAKTTTKKQADNLNMHDTTRPILFSKSDGTVINSTQLELDASLENLVASLNEGSDNSLVTLYLLPSGTSTDSGYLSPSYIKPEISYLKISYDETKIDNQDYVNTITKDITWEDLSDEDASNVTKLPTFYKGANITWEASVPGIVAQDGTITPPLGASTDVTLTASFSYKGAYADAQTETATATFDVTIAPEQALTVYVPFTNYAYSRDSATNVDDPKNHIYGYVTYNGYDCINVSPTHDGYAQLNLKGYEEILSNTHTTAIVSLEAGLQYSTADIWPIKARIAPDSADGYSNETITWNIAEKLGIHDSSNPILFATTDEDVGNGKTTSANASVDALVEAINNSSDSVITLHFSPNENLEGSEIRISSAKSGLFISYYASEIDEDSYFASLEPSFSWEAITDDSQEALVNDLPTYFKGATIEWTSDNGTVKSDGTLVPVAGIVADTITATVTYKEIGSFTKEFNVNVCDGKITLDTPSLNIDGNTATASISVTNGTGENVNYNLYLVVYTDGEMTELVPTTLTVNKGTADSENLTCTVPAGSKVKFLVWEEDNKTPATVFVEN